MRTYPLIKDHAMTCWGCGGMVPRTFNLGAW